MEFSNSGPSSTYSGSPAQSDLSLPLVAPRPQHAPLGTTFDMWHDFTSSCQAPDGKLAPGQSAGFATQHLGAYPVAVAGVDVPGFEMLFDGTFAGMDEF